VQRAWNSPATHGAPAPLAPAPPCSAASSAIVAVVPLRRVDRILGRPQCANLKFHPPCFRRVRVRVTLVVPVAFGSLNSALKDSMCGVTNSLRTDPFFGGFLAFDGVEMSAFVSTALNRPVNLLNFWCPRGNDIPSLGQHCEYQGGPQQRGHDLC